MRFITSCCLVVALLCGCNRNEQKFSIYGNVLEIESRSQAPYAFVTNLLVDQMAPSNVIVAINGYPLTKKAFDEVLVMKAESLMQEKGATREEVGKKIEEFRTSYPKIFVAQRLMIDNAIELGVVTPDQVRRHVEEAIVHVAENSKKTPEQVVRAFKGREKFAYYEIGANYAMQKLVKDKIPPRREVDQTFITNVQAIVRANNMRAQASNEVLRAEMERLRERIVAGEVDFTKSGFGKVMTSEFEDDDIGNVPVAAAAFKLKRGEISEVVEDDDSFVIVRCNAIIPAKKDENDKVISRESRKIEQLYRLKEELFVEDSTPVLTRSLRQQMQMQTVNNYVANLMTNGLNRVEYPYGQVLFK